MGFNGLSNEMLSTQIAQHWHLFFSSLLVSLMVGSFAWRNNFFKYPHANESFVNIQGKQVLKAFFYYIFFQIFIFQVAISFFGFENVSSNSFLHGWVNFFTILSGFIGVSLVFFQLPLFQREMIWDKKIKNFSLGVLTWFISFPIVSTLSQLIAIVVLFLFRTSPTDQVAVKYFRSTFDQPILLWVTATTIIFIVPMAEELLFRGFLQNWIKTKTRSLKKAILLTSAIFAFFHFSFSQGITNIELLFSLFILSCFLGFLYERQRSLWAPIGLHVSFNALSILMILFEN